MKDIDRIRKIFDAMDKMFESGFYGGVRFDDDEDEPSYKHSKRTRSYGGDDFDLLVDKEHIYITMELEGLEEDNIIIKAHENRIEIGATIENSYYESTITLPCKIIPNSLKKTFNNNLLDIEIERDINGSDGDTKERSRDNGESKAVNKDGTS